MKKIFILIVCISNLLVANAQTKVLVKIASNGLAVFCGNDIPSSLHYKIERKANDETDFQFIAETFMPTNLNAFKGQLALWNATCPYYEAPTYEKASDAFAAFQTHQTIDSVFYFNSIPLYNYASGNAFLDVNVQSGKTYTYRITYNGESKQSEAITYKSQPLSAKAKIKSKVILGSIVQLKWWVKLKDKGVQPHVAKVFRSNNLQTPLIGAEATCGFQFKGDSLYAIMTDTVLNKNFYYSYCIKLFDRFGNESEMSDTVSILDKYENTLPIVYLYTRSNASKRGISLSWKFKSVAGLRSIDIYKSNEFDGTYKLIYAATANDTSFIDNDVQPILSYYYYIKLNGTYELGAKSAIVSGMLKSELKPLPPQSLTAKQNGNGILLSWQQLDPITRGYYVFRGLNYHPNKFEQVSSLLLSNQNEMYFKDSIGLNFGRIYSYYVKAVSNDYTIGNASDTVGLPFMKMQSKFDMQAPDAIFVKQIGNTAKIVWQRDTLLRLTTGYELFRREIKADKSKTNWHRIADDKKLMHHTSFTDSTVKNFEQYEYAVKSHYGSVISELSAATSFEMEYEKQIAPLIIEAFNLNNSVVLRWGKSDLPNLKSYKIIRINHADNSEKTMAIISSTDSNFTDKNIQLGASYSYYLISIDKNGIEGGKSAEVGIFISSQR